MGKNWPARLLPRCLSTLFRCPQVEPGVMHVLVAARCFTDDALAYLDQWVRGARGQRGGSQAEY
jgi:hypothetical protein